CDPEENNIESGDQDARGQVTLQVGRFFRPAEGGERYEGRGEPRVQNILVAPQGPGDAGSACLFQGLFLVTRDKNLPVFGIPCRDPMTPPQLARNTPILNV